ncbi:MAG: hypothetical protein ACRENO_05750, partial [Thermodesulfobacteriota bacterium]
MSNLIMTESSFTEDERKILSKIMTINKQMIDDIGSCAQVHIIGKNEEGVNFWQEKVLNNDNKEILEPYMG